MNSSQINGSQINGDNSPAWVIQAEAAGSISFTASPATAAKTAFGRANATLSLNVTAVNGANEMPGRASGSLLFGGIANPKIMHAGSASGVVSITASVLALKTHYGQASGSIVINGIATSDHIFAYAAGQLTISANASAHLIKFGRSNAAMSISSSPINSDVVRYGFVNASLNLFNSVAEPSIQYNGETFFRHEGSVNQKLSITGSIDNAGVSVRASYGVEGLLNMTGNASGHLIRPGAANANIRISSQASGTVIKLGAASGVISIGANASPTKKTFSQAVGNLRVLSVKASGVVRHNGKANGNISISISDIESVKSVHSTALGVIGITNALCKASVIKMARANGVISLGSLRAYGISNSEIPAPDDRTMTVPGDDRKMIVENDDRVMVA